MIRKWLVNLPYPQPKWIEAILFVLLYTGVRFTWKDVYEVGRKREEWDNDQEQ